MNITYEDETITCNNFMKNGIETRKDKATYAKYLESYTKVFKKYVDSKKYTLTPSPFLPLYWIITKGFFEGGLAIQRRIVVYNCIESMQEAIGKMDEVGFSLS